MVAFFTAVVGLYFVLALRECAILANAYLSNARTQSRQYQCLFPGRDKELKGPYPPVAIFHTVCNDFRPVCFKSLINLDYPNKALFVLDDSRTDELRAVVEEYSKEVDFPLFYRRRQTRRGHKAGNVNDGLSSLPDPYRYVFLADSDQTVPRNILTHLVRLLEVNSAVPFIQMHNKPASQPGDEIPEIMVDGHHKRALMTSRFQSMLQTPMCIGHGALLTRWALSATSGLPEIVSEDIAWSLSLLSAGHRGAYYDGRFATEAFPSSYCSFSKRFLRWCVADLECAIHYLPCIVVSRHLSLIEKANLLAGQLRLPSVLAGWAFGIVICLTGEIPVFEESRISLTICLLMALLPVLAATRRLGLHTLALLGYAIPLYFSQMSAVVLETLRFAIQHEAVFYVTGDQGHLTNRVGDSLRHVMLAAIYLAPCCSILGGTLHPILVLSALCECVRVAHHWFAWSHWIARLVRGTTIAWVAGWMVMAYSEGGVWLVEAHYLIVGLSLFF